MDKISASRGTRVVAAGIDMAKSTFSVCGLDAAHGVALERTMNRAKLIELFATMPPCTIRLEACSGAHQLARELAAFGHTVRMIAAKFVAPHRTSGKNDRNDARAIVDALIHPRTRFVAVKSEEQQALLSLQRAQRLCRGAHRAGQPHARPVGRVRRDTSGTHRESAPWGSALRTALADPGTPGDRATARTLTHPR